MRQEVSTPCTVTTSLGTNRDRPRADKQKPAALPAEELSAGAWQPGGLQKAADGSGHL